MLFRCGCLKKGGGWLPAWLSGCHIEPPPDPRPLESDDGAWTPYHTPAHPATVTAPDAACTDGPGRPPTPSNSTTSDDAAPAKRRKRNPRPALPDLAPSQPNLHRWFPTREPGPAASPRAADEHTKHEPADPPDRLLTPGADATQEPAGNWAHLANVDAFARTKRFFLCAVTGPSPHLRTKRIPQVPRTCGVT